MKLLLKKHNMNDRRYTGGTITLEDFFITHTTPLTEVHYNRVLELIDFYRKIKLSVDSD